MSDWRKLPVELSKFATTGLIAFFASFLYTNYATSPTRNITIVPLSIDQDVACDVNRAALLESLQKAKTASDEERKSDYAAYLASLGADDHLRTWGPWPILRSLIPSRVSRKLEDDGILVCNGSDDTLPTHALLRGQAVILLGQPRSYAMSRNCRLRSGGLEVPIRAMEAEVPVMAAGDAEPDTAITVREAMNLFFRYDARDAPHVTGRSLREFLSVLAGRGEYELSISCPIVAPGGPIGVTERAFPFRDRSLIGIGSDALQIATR